MEVGTKFHISDILSVTTGRLLSSEDVGGVYKILNFMTGDDIFTHVIPRAMRICKPDLLLQFPQFDTPEFQLEIGFLIEALEGEGARNSHDLITGWLFKQKQNYGEYFEVKPLDTDDWYSMDPVEEAVETFGKEKVMAVQS